MIARFLECKARGGRAYTLLKTVRATRPVRSHVLTKPLIYRRMRDTSLDEVQPIFLSGLHLGCTCAAARPLAAAPAETAPRRTKSGLGVIGAR